LIRNTPFANYRLLSELVESSNGTLTPNGNGAQLDWITRTGDPTVIGNPHIEKGNEQKSSCITCHARASIGQDSNGIIALNTFRFVVGSQNPANFNVQGVVFYPLDFLWSLSNAKSYQP
jgi:hypothetical protein